MDIHETDPVLLSDLKDFCLLFCLRQALFKQLTSQSTTSKEWKKKRP